MPQKSESMSNLRETEKAFKMYRKMKMKVDLDSEPRHDDSATHIAWNGVNEFYSCG